MSSVTPSEVLSLEGSRSFTDIMNDTTSRTNRSVSLSGNAQDSVLGSEDQTTGTIPVLYGKYHFDDGSVLFMVRKYLLNEAKKHFDVLTSKAVDTPKAQPESAELATGFVGKMRPAWTKHLRGRK